MAVIGTATLNVVPKISGMNEAVSKALGSTTGTDVGERLGNETASGFKKSLASGAIMGAFSQLTSVALSSISSSVGSAIARLDTLKNYPRVMESLGYSTDDVSESMKTMDKHLQGLPTTLNSMTSTVQGITAITGDLKLSTDAALAFNDMILAGGGGMQVAASAGEQFRQMLAKGRPDMQDWRAIISAAPGQVNQLAEALLGAGAGANDLYYALGGGSASDAHMEGIEHASVSVNDLLNAIVKLDQEGGDGVASFADQAKNATGGIQTSIANMQNAITRGLANVFDAIGQDRIRGAIEWVKGGINTAFTAVKNVVSAVMPIIDAIAPALKSIVPGVLAFGGAWTVATKVVGKVPAIASKAADALLNIASNVSSPKLQNGLFGMSSGFDKVGKSLKGAAGIGIAAGIAGVTAAITIAVEYYKEATRNIREYHESLDSLKAANSEFASSSGLAISALDRVKSGMELASSAAEATKSNLSALAESQQAAADSVKSTNKTANASIGQLDAAKSIIAELGGQTDLTSEQYGTLRSAIETVNRECGTQYSLVEAGTGIIADETGAIIDSKDAIYDYIDAKKEQVRVDALSSNLETYYKQRSEAASSLVEQQKALADFEAAYGDTIERVEYANKYNGGQGVTNEMREQYDTWRLLKQGVDEAALSYDEADKAINNTMTQMGMVSQAADAEADSVAAFVYNNSEMFSGLRDGLGAEKFIADLESVGVTQETLASMTPKQLSKLVATYNGYSSDITKAFDEIQAEAGGTTTALNGIPTNVTTNVSSTGTTEVQNAVTTLQDRLKEINGKTVEVKLSLETTIKGIAASLFGNESGAFIPHASGAYIVNRPTAVAMGGGGIHIAGEAGAELIDNSNGTAIVPVERSQYINRIGEAVSKHLTKSSASVNNFYITQREGENGSEFAIEVARLIRAGA